MFLCAIVLGAGTSGCEPCPDEDGDGYTVCEEDCDDSDPLIHPGALESCDSKDNDCDGFVDELCDAPPISSDEVLRFTLSWSQISDEVHDFALESDAEFLVADEPIYSVPHAGRFYLEIRNSMGEPFAEHHLSVIDFIEDSEIDQEPAMQGTTPVLVPVTDDVGSLWVVDSVGESAPYEVPIPGLGETRARAAMFRLRVSEYKCPPEFADPGELTPFTVHRCFDFYDDATGEITPRGAAIRDAYLKIKAKMPLLVAVPITELVADLSPGDKGRSLTDEYCDGYVAALYSGNSIVFCHRASSFYAVLAHELGHRLQYHYFGRWRFSTRPDELESRYKAILVLALQIREERLHCHVDNTELRIRWNSRTRCNHLVNEVPFAPSLERTEWIDSMAIHPVVGEEERLSDRAAVGVVSAYACKRSRCATGEYPEPRCLEVDHGERFAELISAHAMSLAGIRTGNRNLGGIFDLVRPIEGSPCLIEGEHGPEVAEECGFDPLRSDLELLADVCIVEDEDRDGVPDVYDNCNPSEHCSEEEIPSDPRDSSCHNPLQIDQDGDGIGDACDKCEPRHIYECQDAIEAWMQDHPDLESQLGIAMGCRYTDELDEDLEDGLVHGECFWKGKCKTYWNPGTLGRALEEPITTPPAEFACEIGGAYPGSVRCAHRTGGSGGVIEDWRTHDPGRHCPDSVELDPVWCRDARFGTTEDGYDWTPIKGSLFLNTGGRCGEPLCTVSDRSRVSLDCQSRGRYSPNQYTNRSDGYATHLASYARYSYSSSPIPEDYCAQIFEPGDDASCYHPVDDVYFQPALLDPSPVENVCVCKTSVPSAPGEFCQAGYQGSFFQDWDHYLQTGWAYYYDPDCWLRADLPDTEPPTR